MLLYDGKLVLCVCVCVCVRARVQVHARGVCAGGGVHVCTHLGCMHVCVLTNCILLCVGNLVIIYGNRDFTLVCAW
jgi:hypothetical protein